MLLKQIRSELNVMVLAVLSVSCIFASAFFTQLNASPDDDENSRLNNAEDEMEWKENYQRNYFRSLAGNLGEFDAIDTDKVSEAQNSVRIIINPSFQSPLLVSAVIQRGRDDGDEMAYVYAKTFGEGTSGPEDVDAKFIAFSGYTVPSDYDVVAWNERLLKANAVRVRHEQVGSALDSVRKADVLAYPFVSSALNNCYDGTTYFVEIMLDGKQNLFSRHTCDAEFAKDFESVTSIMDLAATKLPDMNEIIVTYSDEILTSTIDQ